MPTESSQKLSEPPAASKAKGARWFKHDSSAHNDPRIDSLRISHGLEGYGFYWLVIEFLRDAPDFKIKSEELLILLRKEGIGVDKARAILQTCYNVGLLSCSASVGGVIWSDRLSRDMGRLSEAGRKAGLASANSKQPSGTKESGTQRPLTPVDASQQVATDNLLLSISDLISSDLKEGGAGGSRRAGTVGPTEASEAARQRQAKETANEYEIAAEKYLAPIDSEPVRTSRIFASTGRRPCKDYPDLWLSRPEFVLMLQQFDSAGVVRSELKHILASAQAKMLTKKAKGADPQMTSAFAWLTGFELEEYLKKRKARLDLKRSETYLENAEATRA